MLTGYVDDTNFITFNDAEMTKVTTTINQAFANYNMQENVDKRELSKIDEESLKGTNIKILGSMLNEAKDISRRIALANIMFYKIKNTWNNRDITLNSKIILYQHLIEPILKYNLAANGINSNQMNAIDIAHRNHIRFMAKIKWTRNGPLSHIEYGTISNYTHTQSQLISYDQDGRCLDIFAAYMKTHQLELQWTDFIYSKYQNHTIEMAYPSSSPLPSQKH
jgi:hypothetical protein